MGNFEKLSVLVIVVIIVMILVVALYTWTEDPNTAAGTATAEKSEIGAAPAAPLPNAKGPTRVDFTDPALKLVAKPGNGAPAKAGGTAPSIFDEFFKTPSKGTQSPPQDGLAQEPVLPPDPASVKPAEPRYHVVAAGETIAKIAKIEYPGVGQRAIDAIIKANPTVDPPRMREGTKLVMPELAAVAAPASGVPGPATVRPTAPAAELRPGTVYVVRQGDTLPGISKRAYSNAGRWQDIWIENFSAIDDPDHLNAGTRLKLPK